MSPKRNSAPQASPRPPTLEWIVAGIGFLLISTAIVLILAKGVQGDGRPPDLSIVVDEHRATRNGWVVEVTIRNHGDQTAAAVQVRASAGEETAEAQLDYVPAQGHAEASLHFEQAPGSDLRVGVVGWREP